MAAIYTANHLEKKYGGRAALRDVSFSIEPGKLVGLLGPNGARINYKQKRGVHPSGARLFLHFRHNL